MIRENIIATSEVDKQNQSISPELLAEYAQSIKTAPEAIRMSINHDSTVIPMGKVLLGTVKKLENGITVLIATIDDFSDSFVQIDGPNEEVLFSAKSEYDSRPFVDYQVESEGVLTVSFNPLILPQRDFKEVNAYLETFCNAKTETTISKSLLPDPEILITLITGFIAGTFVKQVKNKTSDKLSDTVSDDLAKCYVAVKNVIVKLAQKLTSYKQITYIFSEAEQPVELVIRSKNADTVINALELLKDYDIDGKIKQFDKFTNGNIRKIQFLYDEVDGAWKLNYLTTNDGQVIGTEKSYKRSKKMYLDIMNTPGAGFSIGGAATFSEAEKQDA